MLRGPSLVVVTIGKGCRAVSLLPSHHPQLGDFFFSLSGMAALLVISIKHPPGR